jgi:hypothetical protein
MTRRYFSNPELKISSGILLGLMSFFLLITALALSLHYNNLKEDYTATLGAIPSRIIEKNPELVREIIPLITKGISEDEAQKGKAVLSQYGLSGELENELFPYTNKTIRNNKYSIVFIYMVMTAAIFIFNYFQCGYFYERIRKITLGAKRVVEGEYDISISENKEGDLSKLAVSFNSMKEVIRNNLSELGRKNSF